jgi:hypothetical protein
MPLVAHQAEGSIVDVCTLHQEKGIASFLSQASDLRPQTPSHQTAVQIQNALPLDERLASDVVIADRKPFHAN